MSLEWKAVRLDEVGKIITGKTPKTSIEDNYGGNIPFLTPSDDMNIKTIYETNKTLTLKGLNEVKNCLLPKNSVCVSCIGSDLGKVVLTSENTVTNQQINSIIVNDDFDYNFIYYMMILVGKQLNFMSKSSTAVPIINKSTFSKEIINVPHLDEQRKISSILSNIDAKIENLLRINKNLFELSNLIYSDFIKSMDNNDQCTYIELKELGNIVMGQSPKGESYNYDKIGLPLINGAADYENGYLKAQKYTSDPKKTCDKNDLIFCIRATIGLLVVCDKKYCLGRGVAGITNINPLYKEYAFHLINSSIENFKRAATGSVISGISRKDIENIDVIIPSSDEINKYHTIQKPIFDKLENNRIEINNLIKLRDTLLPKLMSGEINVSKINCDLKKLL